MASALEVVLRVARLLESHAIAYVVVGSFASSARGKARATADVDFVADIAPERVRALVEELAAEFYVEEASVRRAVASFRSFNAIHLDSLFKVDVFVAPARGFRRDQLDHRQLEVVGPSDEDVVYVATAEDTILAKLEWFRRGGETSERQWSDVLGVIAVQGAALDTAYLRRQAASLGLTDLLERALVAAEPPCPAGE